MLHAGEIENPRSEALVPQGAEYHPVADPGPTRHYVFVLVPGFTLLAFSSAVEPLRIANQISQRALYHWRVVSESGDSVCSSSGVPVGVDGRFQTFGRAERAFVCSGNPPESALSPKLVAAFQRHARFGGEVGGICTGAFTLAEAGLLTGQAFTLHWENQPGFSETYAHLSPTNCRFELSGRIMTCGGGVAATEMMLSLIAQDHGARFAAIVSDMCLHRVMIGGAREQRSSVSAVTGSRHPGFTKVVKLMNEHIEEPLPLADLAGMAGYSRRHIERMFLSVLNMTPGEYYRGIRIDRGRNLLSTTDLPLFDIAMACGFQSVSHFTKNFRAKFGTAPTTLRRASRSPQT